MTITRRQALLGGLTLSLLSGTTWSPALGQDAGIAAATILLVTGITPTTPAARIEAIVSPLRTYQLPVALVLGPDGDSRFEAAAAIREMAADDGVELVATLDTADGAYRFARLTAAADALSRIATAVGGPAGRYPTTTAATLAPLERLEDGAELAALGIETILRLRADRPGGVRNPAVRTGGYWHASTGVVNAFGLTPSAAINAANVSDPIRLVRSIRALSTGTPPIIVELDLSALPVTDEALAAYASRLAAALITDEAGFIRFLLPRALRRQNETPPSRLVILAEIPADTIAATVAAAALSHADIPATALITAAAVPDSQLRSLPFTDIALVDDGAGLAPEPRIEAIAAGAARLSAANAGVPSAVLSRATRGGWRDIFVRGIGNLGLGLLIAEDAAVDRPASIGAHGVFEVAGVLRSATLFAGGSLDAVKLADFLDGRRHAVLILDEATLVSPAMLAEIIDALTALRSTTSRTLVTAARHLAALAVPVPILGLVQASRAQVRIVDPANPAEPIPRAVIEADAATAWRYFEDARLNPVSPLAFGTAERIDDQVSGWPEATMWDLGSLLLAHRAARRIGLIDDDRLAATIIAVRDLLLFDQAAAGRRPLPPQVIALATGRRTQEGFDAMDVGRLLVALHLVERDTDGAFALGGLIRGWTLSDTVVGGELHNIDRGRLVSVHRGSYAGYAARAFRLWDVDARDPFETAILGDRFDDLVAFAAHVAERGRIAVEPHAQEEIELGPSPAGSRVLDILHVAQIRRFEATGILTAVTEAPIDREPWFTYEGYQIEPDGEGAFVVDLIREGPAFRTPAFVAAVRRVSPKACFLLRATRPGAYTARLHRYARTYGRNTLGFASGISEATGQATNASDINTSGLILESLAALLDEAG